MNNKITTKEVAQQIARSIQLLSVLFPITEHKDFL